MLIIPHSAVFPDAAVKAMPGDVWWAKEPHFDVRSPQFGCPEIHELVIGYGPNRWCVPERVRPWAHLCRWRARPASEMRRGDSKASLEIAENATEAVTKAPAWLCRVYLQNVDAKFPKQVAA